MEMAEGKRHNLLAETSLLIFLFSAICISTFIITAYSQEETVKTQVRQPTDFTEREEALKKEEEQIKSLKKDIDEKIAKYSKLLSQIEEALKTLEAARNERIEHVVKAYESMSADEAAVRLAALDETLAVKIMMQMKSKKAGAVMASMEPGKAAVLTEGITRITKKFPGR